MKATLLAIALVIIWSETNGQIQSLQASNLLQIDVGLSKHGTGDMRGYGLNVSYRKYYRRKVYLSFGIGTTNHSGVFPIYYSDGSGNQVDASYRYSTGGFQLSSNFGISIFKNSKNDFGLQVGVLGRYQTSSYYDEITVLYPSVTSLPIPVIAIINKSPQKTLSIGGVGQIYYNYYIDKKVFVGLTPFFQIDSNGDVIIQFMFSCGFKL